MRLHTFWLGINKEGQIVFEHINRETIVDVLVTKGFVPKLFIVYVISMGVLCCFDLLGSWEQCV